ncbi:hypothetical protein BDP27DRAFT_1310138 [Rhodocollybia butyracea]|uniref:Uncharacterized protein n=1 Tax=Rhodocollybia butyracea TaxID=206335 RepID=A0A9P5QC08_9AGAR|nr:hypothetical protein BDP27DRAFT_1310138 [Rhodocollybia butyracea]
MSGTVPSTSYILPRLIVVMVECMLYGVYAVLFGLAIWILPKKFHISSIKKFIFPATIASFILATINLSYDLVGEAYAILYTIPTSNEEPWMIAGQAIDLTTFLLGDVLSDAILFYRVYAVWGPRKAILLPLFLIIFFTKLIGFIAVICNILVLTDPQRYAIISHVDTELFCDFSLVNACVNILMTLLIAGRVWWLSREIRHTHYNFRYLSWYSRTLAVVIESGAIYPIFNIGIVSTNQVPNWTCLGTIVSGLAPTLIAVRVGLGRSFDDDSIGLSDAALASAPPQNPTYILDIGSSEHTTICGSPTFQYDSDTEGLTGNILGGEKLYDKAVTV